MPRDGTLMVLVVEDEPITRIWISEVALEAVLHRRAKKGRTLAFKVLAVGQHRTGIGREHLGKHMR